MDTSQKSISLLRHSKSGDYPSRSRSAYQRYASLVCSALASDFAGALGDYF